MTSIHRHDRSRTSLEFVIRCAAIESINCVRPQWSQWANVNGRLQPLQIHYATAAYRCGVAAGASRNAAPCAQHHVTPARRPFSSVTTFLRAHTRRIREDTHVLESRALLRCAPISIKVRTLLHKHQYNIMRAQRAAIDRMLRSCIQKSLHRRKRHILICTRRKNGARVRAPSCRSGNWHLLLYVDCDIR